MKPVNQTLLTLIIAFTMLMGFIGVYAVGYEYEQTAIPESIFVSDSNLEFESMDLRPYYLSQGYTFPGYHNPMYYTRDALTSVFEKANATMVYTGNNTWDSAIPVYDKPVGVTWGSSLVYINPALPFLDEYLITSINLKMNLPGDADINVESYIASQHNPVDIVLDVGSTTPIQTLTNYNGETEYDETFIITPYQALKMYSRAQVNPDDSYWAIEIYDSNEDEMSAYNLNMSFEFFGTPITTWTLQDSINVVIGASIIGNLIIGTFMIDSVDFGGAIKDLPKKFRSQSASKGGKK